MIERIQSDLRSSGDQMLTGPARILKCLHSSKTPSSLATPDPPRWPRRTTQTERETFETPRNACKQAHHPSGDKAGDVVQAGIRT